MPSCPPAKDRLCCRHYCAEGQCVRQPYSCGGAIIIGKDQHAEFGLGTIRSIRSTVPHATPMNRVPPLLGLIGRGGGGTGAGMLSVRGMVQDMMGSLRNPAGWNKRLRYASKLGTVPAEPEGDIFLPFSSARQDDGAYPRRDWQGLADTMTGNDPITIGVCRQEPSLPEMGAPVHPRHIRLLR